MGLLPSTLSKLGEKGTWKEPQERSYGLHRMRMLHLCVPGRPADRSFHQAFEGAFPNSRCKEQRGMT